VRRRGLGLGFVAAVALVAAGWATAAGPPALAAAAPGAPAVTVGCLGVDRGATAPQIRIAFVVSGPDGLYRAVLAGPSGPVQGEGRVTGGLGLVIVPTTGAGSYDDLVLTDVDTGSAVDRGPLGDALPFTVRDVAVACDPATLVAPTATTATTVPSAAGGGSSTTTTTAAGASTPDVSTAAPARAKTSDTPPWLLLAVPGALLVIGGVVLLVRARSGSRSRPAT
jgi:hypothetical protein